MADVSWIRLSTQVFDDEKIAIMETMPDADAIIVIWFKLLVLAGRCNDSGLIYITRDLPYDTPKLAAVMRRPHNTVELALKLFQQLGMITIENDIIAITKWAKHQSADKLDIMSEKNRLRQANFRQRQKSITHNVIRNVTNNVTVTPSNAVEEEEEEERETTSHADAATVPDIPQEAIEIAETMCDEIKTIVNPPSFKNRAPDTGKWARDIEKINRIDARPWDEIRQVARFAVRDEFWGTNILSGKKLREKYDMLYLKMNKSAKPRAPVKTDETYRDDLKKMYGGG